MTSCPVCHRKLQIKHLLYAHQCGRSWDIEERAREEAERAQARFLSKLPPQKKDYARLLAGLH
jgi:hypothetical protein